MKAIKLTIVGATLMFLSACTQPGQGFSAFVGDQTPTQRKIVQDQQLTKDKRVDISKIDDDRSYNPHANDGDNWNSGGYYNGYGYGYGYGNYGPGYDGTGYYGGGYYGGYYGGCGAGCY